MKALWIGLLLVVLTAGMAMVLPKSQSPVLMTAADLKDFPNPSPDHKIAYGPDPLQFGELWLPAEKTPAPHPVIMFIHGGCWYSAYDIAHTRFLTQSLAAEGFAVWSVEFRRIGDVGGGWPGSFDDIAAAGEYLLALAPKYNLDLSTFIVSGHSAGGHLAMWYANRPDRFRQDTSLDPTAVVALAPAADLEFMHRYKTCDSAATKLMGGGPDTVPDRYRLADVAHADRLSLRVPHTLIVGERDAVWAEVMASYVKKLVKAGITSRTVVSSQSGHFELIDPRSAVWPLVLEEYKRAAGLADRPTGKGN